MTDKGLFVMTNVLRIGHLLFSYKALLQSVLFANILFMDDLIKAFSGLCVKAFTNSVAVCHKESQNEETKGLSTTNTNHAPCVIPGEEFTSEKVLGDR